MKLDRVEPGDVVCCAIKGRTGIWGEVTEIRDAIVYFGPLCPAAGWRHARAREVVGHWRKAGRRGGDDSARGVARAAFPAGGPRMTGVRVPRDTSQVSAAPAGGESAPPAPAIEPSTAAERPSGGGSCVRRASGVL